MATINSLPNETLAHITDMLKEPVLLDWDRTRNLEVGHYDALRAASLICSRWRDPAQRALYDTVAISRRDFETTASLFCDMSARVRYQTREVFIATPLGGSGSWLPVAKACVGMSRLHILESFSSRGSSLPSWHELADPCFAGASHKPVVRRPSTDRFMWQASNI